MSGEHKEKKGRTCLEWIRFFYERLEESFQNNIPFDTVKELDFKFVLLFGIVLYAVYYGLFAYFMHETYEASIHVKYISLEIGSNCNTVPIVTTGSYLADTNGNWAGESKFVYSKAEFELVFTSFSIDSLSQYKSMMNTFRDAISFISAKTEKVGLIYSLLAWMTYIRYYSVDYPEVTEDFFAIGYGKLQYMQLTGSPSAVFNLRYTQFNLGSYRGVCGASQLAGNSPMDYSLSVIYSLPNYQLDSKCSEALDPTKFDIYSYTNDQFNFALDTRSFSVAMAVNYGILSLADLAPVADSFHNLTVNGVEYIMAQYFDVRYAAMDPIVCYRNATPAKTTLFQDTQLCTILKGTSTLGLPTFNHIGYSYNSTSPAYCEAGSLQSSCDVFMLMSGVVLFPPGRISVSAADDIVLMKEQMSDLITMLDNGPYLNYEDFNKEAYNASLLITASTNADFEPQFKTQEFFNESFKFCRMNYSDPNSETCSVMMFYQYDYSRNFVSEYHFRLENGSRSSSITVTDDCWDPLINNPPVSLIESYYECHPTVIDTLQSAQGIAAGNIDMAMMIIVPILFAPFVYYLLYRKSQQPENEDFLRQHKDELNDLLMNLLLRTMKAEKLAMEAEEQDEEQGGGEGGVGLKPPGKSATVGGGGGGGGGGYSFIPSDSVSPTAVVNAEGISNYGSGGSGSGSNRRLSNGGAEMMQAVIRGISNTGLIMNFGRELYHYSKVKERDDDEEAQTDSCCFKHVANHSNDTLIERAIESQKLSPTKQKWQKGKSTSSVNSHGTTGAVVEGRIKVSKEASQMSTNSDMVTL